MRKLLIPIVVVFAYACSSHVTPKECDEISERCHEISLEAEATAEQKTCHKDSEELWNAEDCKTYRTRCFTACTYPDGGPP